MGGKRWRLARSLVRVTDHLQVGRQAYHAAGPYLSRAAKAGRRKDPMLPLLHAVDPIAIGIEAHGMNVDFQSALVLEDEVRFRLAPRQIEPETAERDHGSTGRHRRER